MRYDIKSKVRTYKNDKGEDKNVYQIIGSAWIGEKTNSIQLDTVPVNWDGRGFLNEPYEKDKPMTQAQALNGGKDVVLEDIDDKPIDLSEIPF